MFMENRKCSNCGGGIEESRKNQRYCKECHNAHARKSRKKYSELTAEQKIKSNCRSYLQTYITRGKITKQPCQVCGNTKVEAHHNDYTKPLEVVWLCREHHLELHKEENPL